MDANNHQPSKNIASAVSTVEQLCQRFTQHWQAGETVPEIDAFVREVPAGDSSLRAMTILELVCIDLQHRWQAAAEKAVPADDWGKLGRRPTADDYAKRFLDQQNPQAPLKWIEAEYHARSETGDAESLANLLNRYPERPAVTNRLSALHANHSPADTLPGTRAGTFRPTANTPPCPNCGLENAPSALGDSADLRCVGCNTRLRFITQQIDLTAPFQSNRFQFRKKLGNGSFGVVWKALDLQLKRLVAIKFPHQSTVNDAIRERFLRESQAVAKLHHEGIVSVYDVCVMENNLPVIVSEYIDGQNLAELIAQEKMQGIRKSAQAGVAIADALLHAHNQGIVHRDLKPANILVDTTGNPHITDFGLAKNHQNKVTMTCDGDVLGTAAYMSPEQARGEGSTADLRSDLYALGVILFEMVTGERPFRGTIQMLLHQVIHDQHPSPRQLNSSVPIDLETIIMKCLEKKPENRYRSASELRDDLKRFLNYEPIHATPPTAIDRLMRWYPSHATQMLGTYFIIAPLTWVFFITGGLWDANRTESLTLSSPAFLPWAIAWIVVGSYILKNSRVAEAISGCFLIGFMALPFFIDDNSQSITLICLISFFGTLLHTGSLISRWLRRDSMAE
ncbi:serine/threonine-protein kinase [Rosistilla ulvae]|uniref:serine/threonine-protein kinase n=1 Tax=Rosistilla ulvae TaxID=1930277 RepID=UPI0011A53340|nr:serine/threonine-protein kinase [Rosistilla ulvae]